MKNIINCLIFGTITTIFLSCSGTHDEKVLNEDKLIDQFISYIKGSTFVPRVKDVIFENGINRAIITEGDAPISVGDTMYFYYVARVITGSSSAFVYETNIESVAISEGLDTESRDFSPKRVIAGRSGFIAGFDRGLQMCNFGDHCFLIFNSELAYDSKQVGIVPPYSPILIEVIIAKKDSDDELKILMTMRDKAMLN